MTERRDATAKDRLPVVTVRDLDVDFWVNGDWYPAVSKASFDLHGGTLVSRRARVRSSRTGPARDTPGTRCAGANR